MTRIWVDEWQQQCCGDPLVVGQAVVWQTTDAVAYLVPILGAELASTIHAREERHNDGTVSTTTTTGTVVAVQEVSGNGYIVDLE